MSALAMYCLQEGKRVAGSDICKSDITKKLQKNGVKVYYNQSEQHITKDIDLVVVSGAILEDNAEYRRAQELNLRIITRGEMLGIISEYYNKTLAISGTHGKSTTTALISSILCNCGIDACVHVGAGVSFLRSFYQKSKTKNALYNFKYGKDVFVTEACEYKSNFLYTKNAIGVITNIESEHLDYFKTYKKEVQEYNKFIRNCKVLVLNYNLKDVVRLVGKQFFTVDLYNTQADVYAANIVKLKNGGYVFDCVVLGTVYMRVALEVIGEHNVYNALCALACAYIMKLDKVKVREAVESFSGVDRRMEYIGDYDKCKIYLDYAHHPTEINATLNAIKQNISEGEVLIVFQPHTYSRTKTLFNLFVQVFTSCAFDVVFLPTYSAREDKKEGYECDVLYNELKKIKSNCLYMTKTELMRYIKQKYKDYARIFFIGAGDIYKIANKLVKRTK